MRNSIKAATAALALVSANVMAAVPASVTTALETSTTDVGTVAAAALGIFIVVLGFKYIRRAL